MQRFTMLFGFYVLIGVCSSAWCQTGQSIETLSNVKTDPTIRDVMSTDNIFTPLNFEEADQKAASVLSQMTLDEKIALIGGDKSFCIRGMPRFQMNEVYMADATQGVHIRKEFHDHDLSNYEMDRSTAFPCPLLLAATWNTALSYKYAEAIGEECRVGGIGILLGPGMNIYRISQCGRNFEYFGEDPFLAARMIENYVTGLQSTGTAATLKHFVANNTDYYRRKSNSIVDERTLHEIYLPAFKAGIDAGAKAVMTAYNPLNGEWCGESEYVINDLLRKQLGFKWLVMTDWWSVYDGEKLARSGQDIEMPWTIALEDAHQLIKDGKVRIEDIDRMAKSILRVHFAMKFNEKKQEPELYDRFPAHEEIALQAAREGIVLLKNEDNILPIQDSIKEIIVTGDFVKELVQGGGAAEVEGYNIHLMWDELKKEFGGRIKYRENPTVKQIQAADLVLCNVGTRDHEGWDRPFSLPEDQEARILQCVTHNPNTVVIVTSGSGIRMTGWNEKAKGVLYAWYGGQIGNKALVEILSGKTNPSGKLPITIEKAFKDSPGYGYLPEGESLYTGWNGDEEKAHPVYDVPYKEGVFVGYRWYENKEIEPLYPFGHGLSYTSFGYSNMAVSQRQFTEDDGITVQLTVKNSGDVEGTETVQLYVEDIASSVPRPGKELKGFAKVTLQPGQSETVEIKLDKMDFSFWNPKTKTWYAEKGKFVLHVGTSSRNVLLKREVELI